MKIENIFTERSLEKLKEFVEKTFGATIEYKDFTEVFNKFTNDAFQNMLSDDVYNWEYFKPMVSRYSDTIITYSIYRITIYSNRAPTYVVRAVNSDTNLIVARRNRIPLTDTAIIDLIKSSDERVDWIGTVNNFDDAIVLLNHLSKTTY